MSGIADRPDAAVATLDSRSRVRGAVDHWLEYVGLSQFWRTKQAVVSGTPLHDLSAADIKQMELMSPLKFNLYESLLCSMPGHAVNAMAWLVGWNPAPVLDPFAGESVPIAGRIPPPQWLDRTSAAEYDAILPSVVQWVSPFWLPTITLLLAWVVAWSTLYKRDSTRAARKRARNAYLYAEGAHGLKAEACFVFTSTLMILLSERAALPQASLLLAGLTILTSVSYLIVTLWCIREGSLVVPQLVFVQNGYNDWRPTLFGYLASGWFASVGADDSTLIRIGLDDVERKPDGPWKKYWAVTGLFTAVLVPLTALALQLVASWCAAILATARAYGTS